MTYTLWPDINVATYVQYMSKLASHAENWKFQNHWLLFSVTLKFDHALFAQGMYMQRFSLS